MILDTSAIIAILHHEPERDVLLAALDDADQLSIGAPTMIETGIVLTARLGLRGRTLLSRFIQEAEVEIVSVGTDHWNIAVDAFSRYGKGRHPAALNFGDCLTYAVAKLANKPLLCIGNDFPLTDLELAINPRQ